MSQGETLRREVTLAQRNGLHLTPIQLVVKAVSGFDCDVRIHFGEKSASAQSAMELMLLGATCGSALIVEATGPDASAAADATVEILSAEGE